MMNLKKTALFVLALATLIILVIGITGCNSEVTGAPMSTIRSDIETYEDNSMMEDSEETGAPMSMIRSDIETYEGYSMMMVNTDSVDIIKRQTTVENKEDLVFVTVKGNNEYYEIIRNYKMRYLLYNDGWIMEEMTEYSDAKHKNITTPLKEYITEEIIHTYLASFDLLEFASFSEDTDNIADYKALDIEKISVDIHENYGSVIYQCAFIYEYYLGFTEKVTIPIKCVFSTYDGSWSINVDNANIARDVVLNQWLIGTWSGTELGSVYLATTTIVNVISHDEDRCYVQYRNTAYKETAYNEGVMLLHIKKYDSGEIYEIYLDWLPEHNNDEFEPLILTGYDYDSNRYIMEVYSSTWVNYELKKE